MASIQSSNANGANVGYSYDELNRLSTVVDNRLTGNNTTSYAYDPANNLTTATYPTAGKNFTYDAENHLTGMTVSGTTLSIVYDAFGNRVSKTVNGVTTKYLVEDDVNPTGYPQVLGELTNGAVTRTYTYGLQRISQDQIVNGAWTPSFYNYDGGGSVRQLTNSAGAITDQYEYDAFGNQLNHTGSTLNNYLYRGEQYDSDLGLYYLRARYYNPATGRFLSRDPEDGDATDPATLHKYDYADSDPVDLSDPLGANANPMPLPAPNKPVSTGIEYLIVVMGVDLATQPYQKKMGCAINKAYSVLARKLVNDANITTEDCTAKGEGRMRIQLQFGKASSGITEQAATQELKNPDPP